MATKNDLVFHVKKGLNDSDEPSLGEKREASPAMVFTEASSRSPLCFNHPLPEHGDAASPMSKKKKLHHAGTLPSYVKSEEMVNAVKCDEQDGRPRLLSPTDVRHADPSMIVGWGSQSKIQAAQTPSTYCQIKTLPPTLRGIADAARVLHVSKSSPSEAGKENQVGDGKQTSKNNQNNVATPPLLLSFPTETVYMLACCVKTASSKSIRKLLSRNDSQTSFSSLSSSTSINDFIHPPNASLEWMLKCNVHSTAPTLFVLDGHHALNFCHFTKPKTFAIRPPSFATNNRTPTHGTPSFAPLPIFGATPEEIPSGQAAQNDPTQAPLTPKPTTGSTTGTATPVTPNKHKLHAANFSESREAFLRLASKFWPGPIMIHVQARMLVEDEAPVSHLSEKPSSSSIASIPSLPSMGDLVSAGNSNPASNTAGVPVLPASVLVPGQESEGCFIGMQCPSHPLPRKILNEIYRGPALSNSSHLTVSHSPSSDSLASISSMDDNTSSEVKVTQQKASVRKNGRARSSIAVVGCMVPGPKSCVNNSVKPKNSSSSSISSTGVTTAADVNKAMATLVQPNQQEREHGRIFVVDGEDNRESFSVPTCQYGRPHPVSLVIDGENRTIHLMRRSESPVAKESAGGIMKETHLTKGSVYRALLEPESQSNGQSFNSNGGSISQNFAKEKKGDGTSIDRVITAVLSRWKIQESVTGSNDGAPNFI